MTASGAAGAGSPVTVVMLMLAEITALGMHFDEPSDSTDGSALLSTVPSLRQGPDGTAIG